MFCSYCGKKLVEGSQFCNSCGKPVIVVNSEPTETSKTADNEEMAAQSVPLASGDKGMENTSDPEQGNDGKTARVLAIILVIILLGVGTGVGIFYYKLGGSKDNSLAKQEKTEAQKTEDVSSQIEEVNEEENLTEEEKLTREIELMNSSSFADENVVDVYEENYKPAKRDRTRVWNDTVFYVMEGYQDSTRYWDKNLCGLKKIQMKNKDTGNLIQYEAYLNPDTNKPNKIVSIEYLDDGLEVMEYYYTNSGKVNFVFKYMVDNYISTYATPDKSGERFLFDEDSLVTWRVIRGSKQDNYSVGKAEVKRLSAYWAKKTLHLYKSLPKKKKKAFNRVEKKMLNAAYNTYNVVMNAEGFALIHGYAYDSNEQGVANATVELFTEDFSTLLYTTTTDSRGLYEMVVPNRAIQYGIRLSQNGMTSCDIYDVEINSNQISSYQDNVYMLDSNYADSCDIKLVLGDAFEYNEDGDGMVSLCGARILVRAGIHNKYGQVIAETTADDEGVAYLYLAPGVYTIEVQASGHETMFYTIVSNPRSDSNYYEFYAPPVLNDDEFAVVLTWGAYPEDLDSHMFTASSGVSNQHIWYGESSDTLGSYLDVDDTTSYGPETVTVRRFSQSNYYKYAVVDYTDCSKGNYSSYDMSNSNACVNVYTSEGLVATYHVPTNISGVIWEVFEIRNGAVTPIQRYYNTVENKAWWNGGK